MKYCSIIIAHYALVDDFGAPRAKYATHTRSELLRFCLESLERHTDYPAEIIVLDNGGNPDDSNYLLDLTRKGVINTYIRYKNNMHWAWAFNEGAKIATGDYLCFTCNDLVFKEKWLSTCIGLLEKYPQKLIATPLMITHQSPKYQRGELDGNRLNTLAGSNCQIMKKETFQEIGNYQLREANGKEWLKRLNSKGYLIIAPPEDLAVHTGYEGGLNWKQKVKIEKTLLKGETIDFYGK